MDLQPASKDINNACHLRKTDHSAIRNVSDMRLADERQQMVFAQGIKLDVFHEDDLARFRVEDRVIDDVVQVLAVTIGEKFKGACGPVRCPEQTLPLGIFADGCEQIAEGTLHSGELCRAAWAQTGDAA